MGDLSEFRQGALPQHSDSLLRLRSMTDRRVPQALEDWVGRESKSACPERERLALGPHRQLPGHLSTWGSGRQYQGWLR